MSLSCQSHRCVFTDSRILFSPELEAAAGTRTEKDLRKMTSAKGEDQPSGPLLPCKVNNYISQKCEGIFVSAV